MGFSTSILKDSAVIQHRLQLEDRGRMEDVPVLQFCGLKITLLIKYSRTNVIASTQEQLDGERRVLDVHPFDEVDERRITDAVVVHRLDFFNEELGCRIRPDHPPGQ